MGVKFRQAEHRSPKPDDAGSMPATPATIPGAPRPGQPSRRLDVAQIDRIALVHNLIQWHESVHWLAAFGMESQRIHWGCLDLFEPDGIRIGRRRGCFAGGAMMRTRASVYGGHRVAIVEAARTAVPVDHGCRQP